MVREILFFLIMCFFVIMGLQVGEITFQLIDLPSLILVLGGVVILLYIAFPLYDMAEGVAFIFSGSKEISRKKYLKLSHLYRATGEYSLFCGAFGTIVGVVLALSTMQDPSTLGPNFSVSALPLFYGMIGKLLSVLASRKLNFCQITEESYEIKPSKPLGKFILALILFPLLYLMMLFQIEQSALIVLDFPSLLIVLGGSIFGVLYFTPRAIISDALKAAFMSKEVSPEQAQKAIKVFAQFNDVVVSMILLSSAAALICLLATIDDPSTIGPRMSLFLISILYGLFLGCLIRGLYYSVLRKLAGINERFDEKPFFSFTGVTLFTIAVFILTFALLLVSMSSPAK
jgi:flagellar motor component MotA